MSLHMRFLPDEPITHLDADLLGYSEFVTDIETAIRYTQTPFVYGVLGDWGTGKTSILRLLEARFTADQSDDDRPLYVVPIWFNAWEYETETNLIYPLLHAVKRSFADFEKQHKSRIDATKFLEAFRDVAATSAFALGDIGFRAATKLLTGDAYKLGDLKTIYDDIWKRQEVTDALEGWTNQLEKLKDAFATLLTAYKTAIIGAVSGLPSDAVRFVILIDDLDRCLPDTTIRMLESIKNYLTVPDAVFVLALNARVVYQGIRHKYGQSEVSGREYLEKILNYTFYVPEPDAEHLVAFAVQRMDTLLPDEVIRTVYKGYFDDFGHAMRDCNFNNPRKIKRVLNRYLMLLNKYDGLAERNRRTAEFTGKRLNEYYFLPTLVRLLMIAEYFPDEFMLMMDHLDNVSSDKLRSFELDPFQNHIGYRLIDRHPQLGRMHDLFNLRAHSHKDAPNLRIHARIVFGVTRLL